MALVTKNDVTQIFAIQAPEVDLPPTFANYPRGWDTARSNNGKPTIKQFNYIQQRTDQNMLWIHQNGAALPYDAAMEYAENAHVVKDGELQKKQGASWVSAANKGYNLDYFVSGKSYPLHAEIMLENGDIVKSTVANNIINPNVDMTGWRNIDANIRSSVRYKLSSYGAKADDRSAAVKNREALIQASRDGIVVVDGNYHIDVTGSTNDFTTSIDWIADVAGGSLNFVGTISSFIRVGSIDHVIVDGVKLTSDNQVGVLMTILNDTVVVNKVQFTCEIETGAGVFRGTWSKTIDPTVQWYGVKHVVFNGSKLTKTNTAFLFVNCPCDLFEFSDVRVKNMSYVCVNFGIENTHAYAQKVKNLQRRFEAYRTITNNDDQFWANAGSGSYLTVVLFEGFSCSIKNCYTEGLKAREAVAIYDFYVGCDDHEYDNNTWKNNICFNSTKQNNELMKGKGSVQSKHTNSTFIVERDFVLRHATDVQSQGWVTLFQKTSGNDKSKATINNNTIDVYMLLGQSSSGFTKNIEMLDNKFKIGVFASTFLNINNSANGITTFADAEVVLRNDIVIDKIGTIVRNGQAYSSAAFMKMNYVTTNDTYRKIELDNNIRINNVESGTFEIYGGLVANESIIKDNIEIEGADATNNRYLASGSSRSLLRPIVAKSKLYTSSALFSLPVETSLDLTGPGTQEFDLSLPYMALSSYLRKPIIGTRTVIVELTAIQNGVKYSATYQIKLEQDGFTYRDATDVYVKTAYPASTTQYLPKVDEINKFDTKMTNVQFNFSTTDSTFLRIRYSFGQAVVSSRVKLQVKLTVL